MLFFNWKELARASPSFPKTNEQYGIFELDSLEFIASWDLELS